MLFENMNWMDVERYLARDDRIVVITGACEQHGYVSLLSDILAPVEIAEAACAQEDVLIAPPLSFGISPYFTTYPGTISLRPETFATVVREVLAGLVAQGFRRILVSNGHGGNTGVLIPVLVELGNAHPDGALRAVPVVDPPGRGQSRRGARPDSAARQLVGELPLHRVGPVPAGEKPMVSLPRTASAAAVRAGLGDGNYGGPYQAPDEAMARFFAAAVEAMVAALAAL